LKVSQFEQSLELKNIAIDLSIGQSFWLRGADMKKISLHRQQFLVVTLPSDEQQFKEFTKSQTGGYTAPILTPATKPPDFGKSSGAGASISCAGPNFRKGSI
jgi:hypothetical protein